MQMSGRARPIAVRHDEGAALWFLGILATIKGQQRDNSGSRCHPRTLRQTARFRWPTRNRQSLFDVLRAWHAPVGSCR